MCGEGAEGGLVAHESMDVNAEELSAALGVGLVLQVIGGVVVGWLKGVGGGGARVVSSGP